MKTVRQVLFIVILVGLAAAPRPARAQAAAGTGASTSSAASHSSDPQNSQTVQPAEPGTTTVYQRPTEREKLHSYLFDAFGPIPIVFSAFAAGVQQAYGHPPEWGGGAQGYGQRFASDYGIGITTTSTRYAFAEVLREDTLYYPCSSRHFWPRLEHAVISTFTARQGDDGHRVFSVPAVVAPFAGGEAAALGWYPGRFEPMDGARIGAYNLLYQVAGNIALEFVYGGPHTLLSRVHSARVGKSTD